MRANSNWLSTLMNEARVTALRDSQERIQLTRQALARSRQLIRSLTLLQDRDLQDAHLKVMALGMNADALDHLHILGRKSLT